MRIYKIEENEEEKNYKEKNYEKMLREEFSIFHSDKRRVKYEGDWRKAERSKRS